MAKHVLILVACLLCCSPVPIYSKTCGRPEIAMASLDHPEGGRKIVGGTMARPGSHPWIVRLKIIMDDHCGGSLIRVSEKDETDIVVTAAHCVYDFETKEPVEVLKVTAGLQFLSGGRPMKGQQTVNVKYSIWHEDYPNSTANWWNDIAILKLSKPIKFNRNVQPICLPTPEDQIKNGTQLIIAGWGDTETNGTLSNVLRQIALPVITHEDCAEKWDDNSTFDNMTFCAGGSARGGRDICQGDSGGPGVEKIGDQYVLQGVVSFTVEGCAAPLTPSGYTRVSTYLCWIYHQVRNHSSVYRRNRVSGDRGFESGMLMREARQFEDVDDLFSLWETGGWKLWC